MLEEEKLTIRISIAKREFSFEKSSLVFAANDTQFVK